VYRILATLEGRGYLDCQGKVETSASQQSRTFRFRVATREVRGSLGVPVKRRRAMLASNPIEE
jgi:hypothetical protein